MNRRNCQIKLFDNQLYELYKIHPTTEQKCRTFLIQLGHSFVYFCKLLTDIAALKNWNVSHGENFASMFQVCMHLTNISILKNWNVSNGKNFSSMFSLCFNLKEIHLPNTLYKLRANMFQDCNPNLKISWKGKIYTYSDLKEYYEFVKN